MPDSRMTLADEAATAALGGRMAGVAQAGDVLLLSGPLGAGKSSFARAFIRASAGQADLEVPSPSFTLLQRYETPSASIYHYDLWRASGPGELEELGWEEALAGIVLVEWPERLGPLAPANALRVGISIIPQGREITLSGEQRWIDAT